MIDSQLSNIFKSCADSIRAKGVGGKFTPDQFSTAILSIDNDNDYYKKLVRQILFGFDRKDDFYIYDDTISAVQGNAFASKIYVWQPNQTGYSVTNKRLSIDLPNCRYVGEGGVGSTFYNSGIAYLNLPNLEKSFAASNFSSNNLSSLSLPKLTQTGNHSFSYNYDLRYVEVPSLSLLESYCPYLFYRDSSLISVNLSSMTFAQLNAKWSATTAKPNFLSGQECNVNAIFRLKDGLYNAYGIKIGN